MTKIYVGPNRYIQGPGVIRELGNHISHLGSRPFILGGKRAIASIREPVRTNLYERSMIFCLVEHEGKGTRADAEGLAEKAREFGADMIVGVGGGLMIDTAKAVSYETGLALVIIPTVASSDAPCSAAVLQYKEDHRMDRSLMLKRNPDVVLVDSRIIAESPTRFFVAGMGDALSTWIEASACRKSRAKNLPGGSATSAGLMIARLCYDTIMEYGLAAKLAVDQHVVTEAVEKVIEANILLSGLGFENCGLAAAHSIMAGFDVLEETRNCLHGELVAFGTLVELVMEDYPMEEIRKVIGFLNSVGLPVTLDQLGLRDVTMDRIRRVAESTCEKRSIRNSPVEINSEVIQDAIMMAHTLGAAFRQGGAF